MISINAAVAGSGGGTTMATIQRATKDGRLPKVQIGLVFASSEKAGLISLMQEEGVPRERILVYPKGYSKDPDMLADFILTNCKRYGINFWGSMACCR
ncbi:MAG: hypothetical protein V4474_00990 [Patescibacteria group bacterium]